MKEIITNIRTVITYWILYLALKVSPDADSKSALFTFVMSYIDLQEQELRKVSIRTKAKPHNS